MRSSLTWQLISSRWLCNAGSCISLGDAKMTSEDKITQRYFSELKLALVRYAERERNDLVRILWESREAEGIVANFGGFVSRRPRDLIAQTRMFWEFISRKSDESLRRKGQWKECPSACLFLTQTKCLCYASACIPYRASRSLNLLSD